MSEKRERTPLGDLKPKDEAKDEAKTDTKPNSIKFNLKAVKKKPSRRYKKGSKYDTILDSFIEGKDDIASVGVEGRTANYMRTQLTKRADVLGLTKTLKISVVNDVCYLEKLK